MMQKKKDLLSLAIFDEDDNERRDSYVREMEDALRRYIKTGVKNKQLDEIIEVEYYFQEQCESIFDITKITESILKNCEDNVEQIENKMLQEEQDIMQLAEEKQNDFIDALKNNIFFSVEKSIQNIFPNIMRDIVYLSHMNMIYEVYEKEEKLREEELQYQKIIKQYPKIVKITRKLNEKRRMEVDEIQNYLDISKNDLIEILRNNSRIFNIRNKKNTLQISLSPTGKKFNVFVENQGEKYTKETLSYLVYKNCNSLMDAMEKSYEGKLEISWKSDHVLPSNERMIQEKYRKLAKKISAENDAGYIIRKYNDDEEIERRLDHEKNEYEIWNEWNRNYDGIIQHHIREKRL